MTRYWAWRIERDDRDFFRDELRKGRLRFGWGYQTDQDLRSLRPIVQAGGQLSTDQAATWKRARRLHPDEPDGMQVGDIVILPNFTADGQWTVAGITGDYDFQIPGGIGDYGHFRPAKELIDQLNPHDKAVDARMRGTMRAQQPLWNLDWYGTLIDGLVVEGGKRQLNQVSTETEKLETTLAGLILELWRQLESRWRGAEFEAPCKRLLHRLFGASNVTHTAGRSENGADLICEYADPLGTTLRTAVQVKMYDQEIDDRNAIEQIRAAHTNYDRISSGVILTTAESESDGFRQGRAKLERELGIPVRCILRKELLSMFLAAFPGMLAELGDDPLLLADDGLIQ